MCRTDGDHIKILREAARETLGPLGLVQKGRSRIWIDDREWHLIVVEFQPSSWSKGSYLNVGAMWLWWSKDYLSFDLGDRVDEFETAESGDFRAKARFLAARAAERVREIRAEVPDVARASRVLNRQPGPGWPSFHAAVAAGLAGETDAATRLFERLAAVDASSAWQRALLQRTRELRGLLADRRAFRDHVLGEIVSCRTALRLPPIDLDELQDSLFRGG